MKYYKEIKNNEIVAYYVYLNEVIQENLIEISEDEYNIAIESLKAEEYEEIEFINI